MQKPKTKKKHTQNTLLVFAPIHPLQVSPPTNLLKHGAHATAAAAAGDEQPDDGGVGVDAESGDGGNLDVFTLSGGLSRDWRLPGALQRLGRWGAGGRTAPGEGAAGAAVRPGAGAGGRGSGGSVSSFLDVKTGCLLEEGVAPRPFTQEVRG